MAQKYATPNKLQARMWKCAFFDAANTWKTFFEGIKANIRKNIFAKSEYTDEDKHYAMWLLQNDEAFFAVIDKKSPVSPTVSVPCRSKISSYIRRRIARLRGKNPSAKKAESMIFGEGCYAVKEQDGKQFLSLMTRTRGERITLELKGYTNIKQSKDIRLVCRDGEYTVHLSYEVKPKKDFVAQNNIQGIDIGYTEVLTNNKGNRYGTDLGEYTSGRADTLLKISKSKQKIYAYERNIKKEEIFSKTKRRKKCRNICINNLGKVKFKKQQAKQKEAISQIISKGIHEFVRKEKPNVIVCEDLRHVFSYDKNRKWNRKLSLWARGELQDTLESITHKYGIKLESVNAAYTSQSCTKCGYVSKNNRYLDKFLCLECGHRDLSDKIGAINVLSRYGDNKITLYTHRNKVKTILEERYKNALSKDSSTVSGKALATVISITDTDRDVKKGGDLQVANTPRDGKVRMQNDHI